MICYDTPGFEIKQGQVKKAIEYSNSPDTWDSDAYHQKVASQLIEVGCVLRNNHFCPVLCYEMPVYGGKFTIPAYGLDEVVELIFEEALMNHADKIANAKISSLRIACDTTDKWVIFYSGIAAMEVAAIALPGADIAALAANEAFMAGHIYDIIFKKSKIGNYDKEKVIKALAELAVPLIGSIGGPVVFNEAMKALALAAAPFTAGLSEGVAVLAGAIIGFAITYALGNTTIGILKKLSAGSITLEQLESKDPKVLAEVGKMAKEQYYAGRKYAEEHPEQIRIRKKGASASKKSQIKICEL